MNGEIAFALTVIGIGLLGGVAAVAVFEAFRALARWIWRKR